MATQIQLPVDPPAAPTLAQAPPHLKGSSVKEEEEKKVIQFRHVTNDASKESMILLTGLKNIYQKQLPKMPREYIARLVYDRYGGGLCIYECRKHDSMAIVKKNLHVVGGITYKAFPGRHFAEIVFCAVTSSEQVKGYGSRLMNHLKAHVRNTTDVDHFLTYADNYAVGYFKKQGFTADVTLDRSVWAGFIKDYEGGTIMQCTMLPKIDYLHVYEITHAQKDAVHEKIQSVMYNKQSAYPGLTVFKEPGGNVSAVDPYSIPGVAESGWHPDLGQGLEQTNPLYPLVRQLLSDVQAQTWSWPFREPVDPDQVPGYYAVIKEPMDFKTMDSRVESNYYKTIDSFSSDFMRVLDNCRKFNDPKSVYVKCANKMEKFYKTRLQDMTQ